MANPKRTVYVGGLSEEVDQNTLRAAFIPFGE
jgi:RNA recognition motif-containing protein